MTDDQITQVALANGFKLKQQPDGTMALNPYVFEFARAIADMSIIFAQIDALRERVDKSEEIGVLDARNDSLIHDMDRNERACKLDGGACGLGGYCSDCHYPAADTPKHERRRFERD